LEKLEACEYDIAILDMQMPHIGGLDVIQEYKSGYGLIREIPFVVLTANISKEAELQCLEAGADVYLQKPIDMNALIETIDRLTEQTDQSIATPTISHPVLAHGQSLNIKS
jgi:two-component system sensor histidine kinase RpfC